VSLISPDLYEVLDVSPRADRSTLARAWRAKRDRVEALRGRFTPEDTDALCAKLDEAFAILSNPRREPRYREYLADRGRRLHPEALFGGLEFEASGQTRRAGPDTGERHSLLEQLLDPPDASIAPWGGPEDLESDPALATPSTEWELDSPPGRRLAPSVASGARSAVRPNLETARRVVALKRKVANDRLLRAIATPPWSS
jgi:hypothetical protein